MPKPTLSQIYHILSQKPPIDLTDKPVLSFVADSRQIIPGAIFIALKGQKYDGHDFLPEVEKSGAIAAIIDKASPYYSTGMPLIRVDNPLKALQQIAQVQVNASKAKIVAITGSLGKTMTKDFIATLLSSKYKTMSTTGNQNSQVGLSLSLLNNCTGDEDYLILEMGMTEPGHIRQLVEIAPPDIALITCISFVHAENFEALEDIAQAKKEIFSHPKTTQGIINLDSSCHEFLSQSNSFKPLSYSMNNLAADIRLELSSDDMSFFESSHTAVLPLLNLPATHVYSNMLAASAVARSCHMNWEEIAQALPLLKLPQRRLQVFEKQKIMFIDDSYNASEESLKAALTVLKEKGKGRRKIAVIGEMYGLGKYSQNCHKGVGKWALDCADITVCLGKQCEPIVEVWQSADRVVFWFLQFEELTRFLKQELQPADVVLLKGSNINGLWRVLHEF